MTSEASLQADEKVPVLFAQAPAFGEGNVLGLRQCLAVFGSVWQWGHLCLVQNARLKDSKP